MIMYIYLYISFRVSEDLTNVADQKMDIQIDMDDNQKFPSKSDGSLSYTSGNEQIDIILTDHLLCCTELISVSSFKFLMQCYVFVV